MLKSISKIIKKGISRPNQHVAKQREGQIIALGGGGFSEPGDNLLLDEYILQQANKAKPKILFLPTAGGDHEDYIAKFYRAYKNFNCKPTHLSLSKKPVAFKKLEQLILSQDAIFVGGGSPRFLMQVWRKTGLDKIIKKAWKKGIVLSGMSAGAICWYEDGFKNPKDNVWRRIACLGFLEGSFCPHYDKRSGLRSAYRKMISSGEIDSGYGVQDGVALHYIGTELKHVISSIHGAKAFYVRKSGFRVTEKEIKPKYLESAGNIIITPQNETKQQDSIKVVREYIKKINEHDVRGMLELTNDNAAFIDSMGIKHNRQSQYQQRMGCTVNIFPGLHC